MGLLALIDLTSQTIEIQETDKSLAERFLGGRGLNMWYLREELEDGIPEPFSETNPLIFGNGLLTGSPAPNSGRMNITSLSPESKTFVDSNCGGFLGAKLKHQGFDRLLIKGRAPSPVYLYVEKGNIEIRDASPYWGLDNYALRREFAKLGNVEIAAIGTAGENLVRYACIMTGLKNAAGRGGAGAVMGSKNLKAVIVGGSWKKGKEKAEEFFSLVMNSSVARALRDFGTPFLYKVSNELGAIRTKNSQLNSFEDSLNAENFQEYFIGSRGCYNCRIACRHVNNLGGEGPEYTTLGLLGANLGIDNVAAIIRLNNLCNNLGLDTSSTGNILGWTMELSEKGLINEKIPFGDISGAENLIKNIARREGFGNILAESTRALELHGDAFDGESSHYLIEGKGLPQSDPHDPRIVKSFALGLAVASRGADHLRNRPTLDMFGMLPDSLMEQVYGQKIDRDIASYKTKHHMVKTHEDIYAVIDSLGLCKFVCHTFNSPRLLGYDHFSKMIKLYSGYDLSSTDLLRIGEHIVGLEREINNTLGLTEVDDTLPRRYFEEPIPLGPYAGQRIEEDKFEEMKRAYYQLRGFFGHN